MRFLFDSTSDWRWTVSFADYTPDYGSNSKSVVLYKLFFFSHWPSFILDFMLHLHHIAERNYFHIKCSLRFPFYISIKLTEQGGKSSLARFYTLKYALFKLQNAFFYCFYLNGIQIVFCLKTIFCWASHPSWKRFATPWWVC